MDTVHPDWERLSIPDRSPHGPDFTDQPTVAALYSISGVLDGPAWTDVWAALIVLFLQVELFQK